MWDFEHGSAGADFDLSYTIPSACAAELSAGTADIGIIPSAAYASIPDLVILPGVAIASRWAVRRAALKGRSHLDPASTFQQSRDHGLEAASLDALACQWSPRLAITEDDVRSYLTENIHYYLDPDCLEGLQLFYQYAEECGVLPAAPALRFLDVSKRDIPKLVTT